MTLEEEMVIFLDHYVSEVVCMICNKYGLEPMVALRRLVSSETYRMLRDPRLEMWDFSEKGIFDLWESEQVTGNPRNSLYIRRD